MQLLQKFKIQLRAARTDAGSSAPDASEMPSTSASGSADEATSSRLAASEKRGAKEDQPGSSGQAFSWYICVGKLQLKGTGNV